MKTNESYKVKSWTDLEDESKALTISSEKCYIPRGHLRSRTN